MATILCGSGSGEKKTLQPKERDDEARDLWLEAVPKLAASRLVFIDETCGWLGLTRLYARIVGGARVADTTPRRRKGKVSLMAAVTTQGMNPNACLIHEGSVNSAAFLQYVTHVLVPTLNAGQVVVMDNFTIHHNHEVRKRIEAVGCELLYLPTYSPDYNPIEHLFAKLKAFLRRLRADTVPDLLQAFADAVLTVTEDDAKNAFVHCGYLS